MALFEWKDKYSVNVKEIDKQHKMLVETLNELHEAMLTRKSREILSGIITSLVDYTKFHFSYEERNMKRFNFHGYSSHKKEHDQFTEKVGDFQKKHADGHLMLSMEIMNFLKNWLKNHIIGTDKQYSSFFNDKGLT
jgi:hemerythrin